MEQNKKFRIAVINLKEISNYSFVIPSYQRPYVWGDDQIIKLLTDLIDTFNHNQATGQQNNFYLSTILTNEDNEKAELIDGQQRFTTLWMIAFEIYIKDKETVLKEFLFENEKANLDFSIRTEVGDYFSSLLEKSVSGDSSNDDKVKKDHPYLKNVLLGKAKIQSTLEEKIETNKLKEFGEFIYTKVIFVKNVTPNKANSKVFNLNKLFSTINSAGVQLEQTDILKANLLKVLPNKLLYGRLWEVCEGMNSYFERNVKQLFPSFDESIDLTKPTDFDENLFRLKGDTENMESPKLTVSDLIINVEKYATVKSSEQNIEQDSEDVYCRPIISFGQLLIHTYRLHLYNKGKGDIDGTFHVNRLLDIFKPLIKSNDQEEIKDFFKLLWKVKFLFDKYVVKWVTDFENKEDERLTIMVASNSNNSYSRKAPENPSEKTILPVMLQSVLYFTGDYLRHYWLTTYLGYLLDNHQNLSATDSIHLAKLEWIDNSLSLCKTLTAKEASILLINNEIVKDFDFETHLDKDEGTKFQHYWFYKLEYVLWKNWSFEKDERFKSYRITSKNSVEHIYPQNPDNLETYPKLEKKDSDSFGNLVLLSVSQNSEYGAKSVPIKRSMFKDRNGSYDTLKSYLIFNDFSEAWNPETIQKHKESMIEQLKQHYNR